MLYNILDITSAERTFKDMLQFASATNDSDDMSCKRHSSNQLDQTTLTLRCRHITTCENEGASILQYGILPLRRVLNNPSLPLARFIKNEINISFCNGQAFLGNHELPYWSDAVTKIRNDNRVNGFLTDTGRICDLDGYDRRPEIIFSCCQSAGIDATTRIAIESNWSDRFKPYAVTFDVKFRHINSIGGIYGSDQDNFDETTLQLLNLAKAVYAGKATESIPVTLKEDFTVEPANVISVEPLG